MKTDKRKSRRGAVPLPLRVLRAVFTVFGPVFPGFFARRAFALWFTAPRFRPPAHEQAAIASARRSQIEFGQERIALWQWSVGQWSEGQWDGGGRPRVLFLHGWSGRASQAAPYIEPLLARGFDVLAYDAPGHGESTGRQTSVLQVNDLVLQLARTHGPFHAAIGHSFGGMVLALALANGLELRQAVSISAPARFDTVVDNFQQMLAIPDAVMLRMRAHVDVLYGPGLSQRLSAQNNAARANTPALIVHDYDDDEIPVEEAESLAAHWPQARLMLTRGLGHRRILRDAEVVEAVVAAVAGHEG